MKIRGFTLIELLAVIVILAIIALIAVPIILNIVGSSKKSAVVRSGELYLKAVETAIARENLNNQFNPTTCIIGNDGNLTCDEDKTLTIQVNGSKPTSGTITLEKGKIKEVVDMKLDGFDLEKKQGERLKIKGTSTEDPVTPPTPVEPEDYIDGTGAIVDLPEGLTPVIYLDNNWKVADTTKSWYNYNNQEWANAVILNAGVTKNVGDTIDVSSEIKGMFVYIPRYEYKIEGQYGTHSDGTAGTQEMPGEIKINFINKETTTVSEGYILHPAFTFGDEQLSGIWVGKFETSAEQTSACYTSASSDNCNNANQTPYIIPNVSSLRYQTLNNQFITAQKFNAYINNSRIDAHMSKNSEWGAVAYLSQSRYGKYGNASYTRTDKQVMINNCKNYITGVGADSQDAPSSTSTCTFNTYTTAKGQAASTTGNITGVYDMSGGAVEHVMGVLNKTVGNSGISTWPDEKYYDNYTVATLDTACNSGICYGHALSETTGWYGDYNKFVVSSYFWFTWLIRGGIYDDATSAGVFSFYDADGDDRGSYSFRIVLVGV